MLSGVQNSANISYGKKKSFFNICLHWLSVFFPIEVQKLFSSASSAQLSRLWKDARAQTRKISIFTKVTQGK